MQQRLHQDRICNVVVVTSVLGGGVAGLLIANALWPTPEEFRQHGWEPGLIMLICMFSIGGLMAAVARWRGQID
ncbi:hypothetical protein [Rhodovibrio sodomensis]|uniref:hypothetical protein n=1 Tax=Rhodovibrio sodomensis TaxID=1088 RepID=UPI00190388EA|nr:hypothetical protein [Rhodovibrio sodomensis]